MESNAPGLFDVVKLHVAEKYPELVVEHWEKAGQIRISLGHIVPMHESCVDLSLVSITERSVYYHEDRDVWWRTYQYSLASPNFFDRLDEAIDYAITKRKEYELQKSRAD